MPVPMLKAMASFSKETGRPRRISKNFLFDSVCRMWVISLVFPLDIVEVVFLHPG